MKYEATSCNIKLSLANLMYLKQMGKRLTLRMASAIKIIYLLQTMHILYKSSFNSVRVRSIFDFMMDSPKLKRQHVDHTLKEKLDILKYVGSMKGIDICRKFGIKQLTLSTWKKKRKEFEQMVEEGKILDQKRNRGSFLPQVERALHIWFCEMRSKPHTPPLNREVLVQKAT